MPIIRKSLVPLCLIFALLLSFYPSSGRAAPPAQNGTAAIKLRAATFNPHQGHIPALPAGLSIAGYAPAERGYYIIQFQGPVRQTWKKDVTAVGVELLDYLPDFAFKARMDPAQAALVAQLESVAWVGLFHPAYKLSPGLIRNGQRIYRVRVERGADIEQTATEIAQSGAHVLARVRNPLLVVADAAQVDAIARVDDVAWVENFALYEKHNEFGAGVILGANTVNANGYDGSSQIVAVADTGLGDGTKEGAHSGISADRIVEIFDRTAEDVRFCYRVSPDGPHDVDSGHGTHVAVSVVGAGDTTGVGRGTAPSGRLVFQAVEDYLDWYGLCTSLGVPDGYYLPGIPEDLHELYQQAYDVGARIHSNSWGSADAGEYSLQSAQTDDFIWHNPDMAITFSAGNAGTDANGDGVIDDDSVGSPATAKNVITVGASENDRQGNYACDTGLTYTSRDAYQPDATCSSMGGQNILGTYGVRWADSYPAEPIASDSSAGNAEQMAAFSSRGPTDDGRIKPDVVAPGTWVLSGYSALYQEGYGSSVNVQTGDFQMDGWGMPLNNQYKYFGGTSMSNPLTAGAATVVRDFYQKAHGHSASAALVKAALINSAVDLLDENNDSVNDNAFPIPNRHEGWGRVNLAAATAGSHQFYDEASGLHTDDSVTYQIPVNTTGAPLKISLVWSDYAAAAAAIPNLVNDLDLTVTAPDGLIYRGNVFGGGWSQPGGDADRINNVENVYIAAATPGMWTVHISGYNVPMGPQPFALVVDGDFAQVDLPPSVHIVSPMADSPVSGLTVVQIDASDAEDAAGALSVEWTVDDGTWQPAAYNADTGYYEAAWDSTTSDDGPHILRARAQDSASNATTTEQNVVVHNAPGDMLHIGDLDARSSGLLLRWNAMVLITVHDASEDAVPNATVHGVWSTGGPAQCNTNSAGQCEVTLVNLWRGVESVTFAVDDIAHASATYNPDANHDADGDSDGTQIAIQQPARALLTPNEQSASPADGLSNPIYLPLITN